jgi:hypothetical protein
MSTSQEDDCTKHERVIEKDIKRAEILRQTEDKKLNRHSISATLKDPAIF